MYCLLSSGHPATLMPPDRKKQETCVFEQKGEMSRLQEPLPSLKETCTTKQAAITPGAPAFALLAWPWLPVLKAGASGSGSQLHLS